MKKVKVLKYFIFFISLFFISSINFIDAFTFVSECQSPITRFSNGESGFEISFPPGGGTTCLTTGECPKIFIPADATVFSVKVSMSLTNPDSEIKTPYVWIPVTHKSDGTPNNKIKQIDANDCSVIESYDVISEPSRTYVIPGGDTWVASRTGKNVSKLSPLHGNTFAGGSCGDDDCGTDENLYFCPEDCYGNVCGSAGNEDCRKYEVMGSFDSAEIAGGVKGVTGDIEGNIWVGNYSDGTISKLDGQNWPTSKLIADIAVGVGPYGMIGDPFGHIWISNRGNGYLQCVDTSSGTVKNVYSITLPYGISMDEGGNIYIACYECGTVLRFDAIEGNCPDSLTPSAVYDTQVKTGTRGVGIDQRGFVWTANSFDNELYVFTSPDDWFNVFPGGAGLVGVAIDFDGYGWVVSYSAEVAYKYSFSDTTYSFDLMCTTPNLGGKLYNYSDMTGLRSVPKIISFPGIIENVPISATGVFEICTDGTGTCSDSGPCGVINAALSGCIPDGANNCEIPLEIFSMQAGNYTLNNLEIIYSRQVPVTTGGIMPCGRKWNDPATTWDDTDSCGLCHFIILASEIINFLMEIIALISILALVVGGLIYVKAAGNTSLILSAKQNINKILYGFVIIFVAWVIVNTIMILFGFSDPLGDGSWKIFTCDL